MAAPIHTPLPDAPNRSMAPAEYIAKSNAFVAAYEPFGVEMDEVGVYCESKAAEAQAAAAVAGGYARYKSVGDLLISTEVARGTGVIWEAGGFRYEEVASGGDISNSAAIPVQLDVLEPDGGGFDVRAFGAIGDDATVNTTEIQKAIDSVSASGGGDVVFSSGVYLSAAITIKANVRLVGAGATIKAVASVTNFITMPSNSTLQNMIVDADNNVGTFAIIAADFDNVKIMDNEVINWDYGITAHNDAGSASTNLIIEGNYVHTPSNNAIYPIWVNAKAGKTIINGSVSNNMVVGVSGEYSPTNNKTADQIELHGIDGFNVCGNVSKDGGEIGLVLSRLSQNCIVTGNIVSGCDADGIQIGSGAAKLTVATTTSWSAGDTIVGGTSGATGIIETIIGNDVYVNALSGGKFVIAETATANSVPHTITAIQLTQNIVLSNNISYNNGIDVGGSGAVFAGIKMQQADNISLVGNKSFDTNDTKIQQFGLYVSQCDNVLDLANDFARNLTSDVSLNGVYTFNDISSVGDFAVYNLSVSQKFSTKRTSDITIAAGVIAATGSYHRLDTEAAASTDDLDTINGGTDGMIIVLQPIDDARSIVVKDAVGNLNIQGDFTMNNILDTIQLIYNSNSATWCQLSRNDNAA